MLFGQHFDGEPPRNLNHVFLRQFGNGFNKKIGMFMFKNQNDGATLRLWWGLVCLESTIGLKWVWRVKNNTRAGRWKYAFCFSVLCYSLCCFFFAQITLKKILFALHYAKLFISSRIAGPGELFNSDFRACARSLRWTTRPSFGLVKSAAAAMQQLDHRSTIKRAHPVASSPLSEQRRTWLLFCRADRNLSSKAWLATFKARNANLKL